MKTAQVAAAPLAESAPERPGEGEGSLKRRSVRAGVWVGGSHVVSQVLRLAGNLVMTRLLLPEAFGLMAIVLTVWMALGLLSDIGSGTVMVQSERGADEDFVNTAWTLQVIRGVLLWLAALLVAWGLSAAQAQHWIDPATAYGDPRLPALIAAATFGMVIYGCASLNGKLAERRLDLRLVSLIELAVQVGTLVATVVLCWFMRSIWALVLGGLVNALLQCALTHLMYPGPRARLRLEPEAVHELIGKGKWVLLSSLLGFLAVNGDRVLLGGYVDGTTLGLYSIAFGLAGIAPAAFAAIIGKVMYPAFSEVVRDRPADLARSYARFQQVTDVCLGLLAGALFVASDAVIGLLYDQRYQGAGHILALLAIGSIGARFVVVEQIYLAVGQPSLMALAGFSRALVLFVALPIGHAVAGFNGALVAIVLGQFAHWPLAIWFRCRQGLTSLRNDMLLLPAIAAGWGLGWGVAWLLRLIDHHL